MLIEETKKHLRGDASGLMLLFDFKLPRSGLVQQANRVPFTAIFQISLQTMYAVVVLMLHI